MIRLGCELVSRLRLLASSASRVREPLSRTLTAIPESTRDYAFTCLLGNS